MDTLDYELVKVCDLAPGDMIDLRPSDDPDGQWLCADRESCVACDYEYVTVAETETETEACTLVHFDNHGSMGFSPDLLVRRHERGTDPETIA